MTITGDFLGDARKVAVIIGMRAELVDANGRRRTHTDGSEQVSPSRSDGTSHHALASGRRGLYRSADQTLTGPLNSLRVCRTRPQHAPTYY
jgi:hypothetical protein